MNPFTHDDCSCGVRTMSGSCSPSPGSDRPRPADIAALNRQGLYDDLKKQVKRCLASRGYGDRFLMSFHDISVPDVADQQHASEAFSSSVKTVFASSEGWRSVFQGRS